MEILCEQEEQALRYCMAKKDKGLRDEVCFGDEDLYREPK